MMSRQLMNGVKYTNICDYCHNPFISYGWTKKYCKLCLPIKREELAQIARDKGIISYKAHTKKILKKCPQIGYGHCGEYKGLFCQSTWELAVAIWAFSEGLSIKRSPLVIYYQFEGKQHRYHPDFEIDNKTYEVKGRITPQVLAKQVSAAEQGIDIVFVDEEACEFYFEYVYSKHGMDPRMHWTKFYDQEIVVTLNQEPTKSTSSKKYPLHKIFQEPDIDRQKELLFESSFIFRDKEILESYIRRMKNENSPQISHINDLEKAQQLLYPNS